MSLGSHTTTLARVSREQRRQIPLTSFTLLTVPEDSMLSHYLKKVDTIDVSMMERSLRSEGKAWPVRPAEDSLPSPPDSQSSSHDDVSRPREGDAVARLELDLDKFMGSITASDSPDAVIKTIARSKSSMLCSCRSAA
ncbi:uncharacterized protein PV06_09235 [Exophiala oligosperma]|uniref:Uncharacterized protein n=1 Tax=Exophiala oligosperma TaxID=215243 RepID=A0A0D2DR77_9EURO|nr:uncharacterized protein PV06_09235 [Exophiala oligosperma]KIW38254.1 hypothetical protein PV06_09235 [Exophiala oligosperma]